MTTVTSSAREMTPCLRVETPELVASLLSSYVAVLVVGLQPCSAGVRHYATFGKDWKPHYVSIR